MSPSVTMLQNTVGPNEQGSIVSAFHFYLTIVGCFSCVLLGNVANFFGAAGDPTVYGKLIFGWSLLGYLGSIPCFYKGGKFYKEFMENKFGKKKGDHNT